MALDSASDVTSSKPKTAAKPKATKETNPPQGEPKNDAPFTDPVGPGGVSYTIPGTPGGDLAAAVAQAIGAGDPNSPSAQEDGGAGASTGGNIPDYSGIDFSQYLNIWGLPGDVQSRVLQIFQSSGGNTDVATQEALAYIRGTDWYAQTYPGIQVAEAKGLVTNEADYRSLLNQQTQIYKQYLGRDISTDEFAANLNEGVSNTVIGQRLQGNAYAQTYGSTWNYALGAFDTAGAASTSDLQSLGQEQAGLDTPMGQMLQNRLNLAQQRLQGVFKGPLAAPSLGLTGGKLAGPKAGVTPDIAAT